MSIRMRSVLPCLALVAGLGVGPAGAVQAPPCAVVSKAEIAKATGLTVGDGVVGQPLPGVLGRCTWTTAAHSRVILTLADAHHMQLTVDVQKTDGTVIPGIGKTAVGVKSAPFTGGGYIVSVLDAQGGFGVSILGSEGNRERAVALAKVVESHR